MYAFICDYYLYCVITQHGLSLESCTYVQVQVCHDKFIHFSSLTLCVKFFLLASSQIMLMFFFFNVNAEHSHPIYLINMSH